MSNNLSNSVTLVHLLNIFDKTAITSLISRVCLHSSSLSTKCVWENANCGDTCFGLGLFVLPPSSKCLLQVCLSPFVEPCEWIHSSHTIWCQQTSSAVLIHSRNSPRSVSSSTGLKDGQVSQEVWYKTHGITSLKVVLATNRLYYPPVLQSLTK